MLPLRVHQAYTLLLKHGKLNKRLAEIFYHYTKGKSYKEIAAIMGKSHRTIEKDGFYLRKYFGFANKKYFVRQFIELGWADTQIQNNHKGNFLMKGE